MSDEHNQFKRSLLRMLQVGAFEEMLGCEDGQSAAVEFRLERVYRVQFRRRTIVLKERDSETVRRKLNGRWQRLGPSMVQQDRVVIKRHGNGSQAPNVGRIQGNHRPAKRQPRQPKPTALGKQEALLRVPC